MYPYLLALWTTVKARWDTLRKEPEAGYSTEFVLLTALVVAAAVAFITIIITKVIAKANSINM